MRYNNIIVPKCPVFPKVKKANHLLESTSCVNNFCWIRLILKNPYSRLLFLFRLIRVNPLFITCHDVINLFRSTAIDFFLHFFRPIDTSLFLSVWQDPTGTNFCYSQMFIQSYSLSFAIFKLLVLKKDR